MQYRHPRRPLSPLGLAAVAAFTGIACIPTGSPPQTVTEQSIDVPDAAPQVLLESVRTCVREASALQDRLVAGRQSVDDLNALRTNVFRGVKAADKVIADPSAGSMSCQEAEKAKLDLLGIAAARRLIPDTRLKQYVEDLVKRDPTAELAADATAEWLRYELIHGAKSPAEVLPVLAEFARNQPDCAAGFRLLADYGKKLDSDRNVARSLQCYRLAMALYGERPEAKSIEGRLAELEETERKASAARAARQQIAAARLSAVQRQFGGFPDGYFVVYAEENVKPPRHGGIYFYRYEYDVLEGLPAAAAYVEGLPEKWSWKLIQRFPESPDGRKQAYELWKTLVQRKRKTALREWSTTASATI